MTLGFDGLTVGALEHLADAPMWAQAAPTTLAIALASLGVAVLSLPAGVAGRVHAGALLIDLRSVLPEQDGELLAALRGLS